MEEGLRKLGYAGFRPGQQEAVQVLFEQGRLLLVAPTGGGKSLTYQLPATLLQGTTLVISPLIALMHDQVEALRQRGVAATFLASTLDNNEMRKRSSDIAEGRYSLVYVAPERLTFPGFRHLLRDLACPLVAVDEAHCISEWGHDFRPEYMQIGEVVQRLPKARVLACTATATPVVRDEILARLGLPATTPQLLRGFARPNLVLRAREVEGPSQARRLVDNLLYEALGGPGRAAGSAIVYASTRRKTEQEAERLKGQGFAAGSYHAGLPAQVRAEVQSQFSAGELEVVVATNAFGMGIDRSDVRAVAHLSPPASIEAYYQEVGRGGRDGEAAYGLLLASPNDMALRRRLMENRIDGRAPDPRVVEHKWQMFLELMRLVEGEECRHDAVLRYFGDEAEVLSGCGRCDVCTRKQPLDYLDGETTTLLVRKALSGVARVHGEMGLSAVVGLLQGKADARLERAQLTGLRTFGVLSGYSKAFLMRVLRRCITAGFVTFTGEEHPLVALTPDGVAVMRGQSPANIRIAKDTPATSSDESPATAAGPVAAVGLDAQSEAVFQALRAHRMEVARAQGVPPFMIASDRTLRDLAVLRPGNLEELKLAHGIGPAKVERYGAGFLEVVRNAAACA